MRWTAQPPEQKIPDGLRLYSRRDRPWAAHAPRQRYQDSAGGLWIAKLPARNDTVDVGRWEYLVHRLAREAGINVPAARIESLSENGTTFLVQRFDRTPDTRRVHFASAMTLLAKTDNDERTASYLDLAEIISRTGDRATDDLVELWSRIAFYVAVSNCDDHLRNHGFLLGTQGWQLSPAYDINPDPTGFGLSLEIDATDNRLNFDLVRSVAPYFGLSRNAAERRLADILGVVSRWRDYARQLALAVKSN